ncbi:MAG: hypothetical protein ACK56I_24970, partial [bacterium]
MARAFRALDAPRRSAGPAGGQHLLRHAAGGRQRGARLAAAAGGDEAGAPVPSFPEAPGREFTATPARPGLARWAG